MNAMKVFSASIKYLKDHFVGKIESLKLVENDIHWVLTVPAIWKDNAKQFMRSSGAGTAYPSEAPWLTTGF
jgi:hypothetical protein